MKIIYNKNNRVIVSYDNCKHFTFGYEKCLGNHQNCFDDFPINQVGLNKNELRNRLKSKINICKKYVKFLPENQEEIDILEDMLRCAKNL